MADDITLEQGLQAQAEREAEFARIERQQRVNNQQQARSVAARSTANRTTLPGLEDAQADLVKEARLFAWQRAHEIIEGLAFQFFFLGALLAAPLADGLFVIRYFGGNVFNGGSDQGEEASSIWNIPSISNTELIYRGWKLILINLLSGLEWLILILIVKLVTDPKFATSIGISIFSGSPTQNP